MTSKAPSDTPPADPWAALRRHTPARIALGRAGTSLPTAELLRFAAAHAQARDAVHLPLDALALAAALHAQGWTTHRVHSRAPDRQAYLRRPDWGRQLDAASAQSLAAMADRVEGVDRVDRVDGADQADRADRAGGANRADCASQPAPAAAANVDLVIVLGDGLSATAVQQHAVPLLAALRPALSPGLTLAPLVIAQQARVALADEIGALLGAGVVLMLLGERPGLSAPDSLGAYLTYRPQIGCTDAQRNCVSNIRPAGLPPAQAALRLAWLLHEALRRRVSGLALKDDSAAALLPS